jgi:hypothetical protein
MANASASRLQFGEQSLPQSLAELPERRSASHRFAAEIADDLDWFTLTGTKRFPVRGSLELKAVWKCSRFDKFSHVWVTSNWTCNIFSSNECCLRPRLRKENGTIDDCGVPGMKCASG